MSAQQDPLVVDGMSGLLVTSSVDERVRPHHGAVLSQLSVPASNTACLPGAVDEWDLGPFTHVRDLRLGPVAAHRGFHFQARGGHIGELVYAVQYSDDFTGVSGAGPGNEPLIGHFIDSGWMRFEDGVDVVTARPGQAVFRDTRKPWRFWSGPSTRSRIVIVPRDQLTRHASVQKDLPRVVVADAALAEVRLLDSYLALACGLDNELFSSLGRDAGQEAGVQLLVAAMGAAKAADSECYPNAMLAATRSFINEHLDDSNLGPNSIAGALHVSVRTLHRIFREVDDSVMAYVRRERLSRARIQLLEPGARVAEVAARWQFSDTSHFIRQFKIAYGVTPSAYVQDEQCVARGDSGGRAPAVTHITAVESNWCTSKSIW